MRVTFPLPRRFALILLACATLCIASAGAHEDRTKLFNKLLIWGLSMSVVGAVVCFVFFGLL